MKKIFIFLFISVTLVLAKVDYSEMSTEELIAMMGYVKPANQKVFEKELKARVPSMSAKEKKTIKKILKSLKNSMGKAKILLLEDDMNLNETLCEFLEENEYQVVSAYDGNEAEEKIYEERFDLFLLDVNVPGINGFELLKNLREEGSKTPAIYLTSLNSVDDLSVGYEMGCDDYIRKPFALKELLLRVESILKREFYHNNSNNIKIVENIEYDTSSNELVIAGESVRLQNKEALLLKLFMQKRGEIISHEVIRDTLWEYDEVASDDALRTYIKNLRKIIGKEYIISVKKLGYKFIK